MLIKETNIHLDHTMYTVAFYRDEPIISIYASFIWNQR